jgi:hypothetical protein
MPFFPMSIVRSVYERPTDKLLKVGKLPIARSEPVAAPILNLNPLPLTRSPAARNYCRVQTIADGTEIAEQSSGEIFNRLKTIAGGI